MPPFAATHGRNYDFKFTRVRLMESDYSPRVCRLPERNPGDAAKYGLINP